MIFLELLQYNIVYCISYHRSSIVFTGCNKNKHFVIIIIHNETIYYIGSYDSGYIQPINNTNINITLYYTNNIPNSNKLKIPAYVPTPHINANDDDDNIYYMYYAIDLNTLQKCHIEIFDYKLNYL